MTENEKLIKSYADAIDCLKKNKPTIGFYMLQESVDMAIKALEEIQQYHKIGTVEECRAAVEKQKAKKMESAWCPCCGKYLTTEYMNKKYHCIYCGQKLDWGDEE